MIRRSWCGSSAAQRSVAGLLPKQPEAEGKSRRELRASRDALVAASRESAAISTLSHSQGRSDETPLQKKATFSFPKPGQHWRDNQARQIISQLDLLEFQDNERNAKHQQASSRVD